MSDEPSILVIGGSGRLGLQIIRNAATRKPAPLIHVLARTPSNIRPEDAQKCASVQQGDALNREDVERALTHTSANAVIMTIGVVESTAETDLRHKTAEVLADLVKPGAKFDHVKVVVVSSLGAGGTKIQIGFGIGIFVTHILRHILKDHDLQEETFQNALQDEHRNRLLIVRPTRLLDDKATGSVQTFEGKCPNGKVDRADVAKWILDQFYADNPPFGTCVNVTSV